MTHLAFIHGLLAGAAALLIQVFFLLIFEENFSFSNLTPLSLIGAALIEEIAKLIFLLQILRRSGTAALQWLPLILFGSGFATLEIFLATLTQSRDLSAFLPIVTNIFFHIATVLPIGLVLRYSTKFKKSLLFFTLLVIIILHSLYNFFKLQI